MKRSAFELAEQISRAAGSVSSNLITYRLTNLSTSPKIILAVFVAITLFVGHSLPALAGSVLLWQDRSGGIYGTLPDDWRIMTSEELVTIAQSLKNIMTDQPNTLVAGFQADAGENNGGLPRILVFVKSGERVSLEMIQKTFLWLQKNNDMMAGMLPEQIDRMNIENIEYWQEKPSIFFQTRLALGENAYTGVSQILFLNDSYLNIVCIANERTFADQKGIFYSFIKSISIPDSLQYAPDTKKPPDIFSIARYKAWFLANWKQLLGAAILLGIYSLVFRSKARC